MLSEGLQVLAFAAAPILELRFAIPYGISVLKLGQVETFIWAVAGNFLPIYFILKYMDFFVKFLFRHIPWLHKHMEKYFQKIHHAHSEKFNKVGYAALAAFVAIPFPGTGAWTGALIAYLFAFPLIPSLVAIFIGILGAGIIMTSFWDTALFIYNAILY